MVELLTGGALAHSLARELAKNPGLTIVPQLLDVEVLSALRKMAATQRIDPYRVDQMLKALAELPVERCAHIPMLSRIWELRRNFTAYDAAYIALAEGTGATLYTSDVKLSEGHRARVSLFTQ